MFFIDIVYLFSNVWRSLALDKYINSGPLAQLGLSNMQTDQQLLHHYQHAKKYLNPSIHCVNTG